MSPLLTVLVVHNVRHAVAMLGVHRFGVQMREYTLSLGLTCPVSFGPYNRILYDFNIAMVPDSFGSPQ